jgi:aminoglycoside 3'-phosphotransferase-1
MNSDREEICIAPDLPAGMTEELHGYSWARDLIGESGGSVYRLHGKPGTPALYLKHGHDAVANAIVDEMVRLRWLAKYISAPTIRCFTYTKEEAWLLMTALPGETAYQVSKRRLNRGW